MEPERIILKHVAGSKTGQTEEFPLSGATKVSFGRAENCDVPFDPTRDDRASRNHATIERDPSDPSGFQVVDTSSGGTFVNGQKVSGSSRIKPGDTIEFGRGGPSIVFDLSPRPRPAVPGTRVEPLPPMTRVGEIPVATAMTGATSSTPVEATRATYGAATVERRIDEVRTEAKQNAARQSRQMLWVGSAAVVLLLGIVGGVAYKARHTPPTVITNTIVKNEQHEVDSISIDTTKINKDNRDCVVYINVNWKLFEVSSGQQVIHLYKDHKPVFLKTDDSLLPFLGTDPESLMSEARAIGFRDGLTYKPISERGTASGFVITSDGFILTNKHVAAAWDVPFHFTGEGLLYDHGTLKVIDAATVEWVPSRSFRSNPLNKTLEGQNDVLEVKFPETRIAFNAQLQTKSDESDVALIKISTPASLKAVTLGSSDATLQPGDKIAVMGYPGINNPTLTSVPSAQGVLNGGNVLVEVPNPTITEGNIARTPLEKPGDGDKRLASLLHDSYQHTAATNPGNSGGPVFDRKGQVIGINTFLLAGMQGANFFIPIRYGNELMGPSKITH